MRTESPGRRTSISTTVGLVWIALALCGPGLLPAPGGAQPAGGPAAGAASIGRDEAIALVTRTQLGGSLTGVRLYVDPRMMSAGEAVPTWRGEVFRAATAGWFIFIDRVPGANWEHSCSYVFVDAVSGGIRRFEAMAPPRSQPELLEITHGRDDPPPGISERELARFSKRLGRLPRPVPARSGAWALIISGGGDPAHNYARYWNDCAFIYRALVQYYGYPDDHIRVLISDGTDPAIDRNDGTSSPTDLDGDGDVDTDSPATLGDIRQVFGELASTLTPDDQLFIYTTDHGVLLSGDRRCALVAWTGQLLTDDQMAACVAALPCASITCCFEQCYSGGMIDDLAADGRVIATACNFNEVSYPMPPDYTFDSFVYHWTSVVARQNPDGDPVDSDANGDGVVSMREAFLYAQANDHVGETPQYSSTPSDLGDRLNLFANPDGVYLVPGQLTIDDDNLGASHGNGDGVIGLGETIELTALLHNIGLADAYQVAGTLQTDSPHVIVTTETGSYGAIPAGGAAANAEPFVFRVANEVEDGEPLKLTLNVTELPGSLALNLRARAPSYLAAVTAIDDTTGDRDGQADPGELVGATLRIENRGGCDTPELAAVLHGNGYFTTDERPHPVGVIRSGSDAMVGGFAVRVAPECPGQYAGRLVLELTGPEAYDSSAGVSFFVGPWFDDAELDQGWTLGASGDNAFEGRWVCADPVGTTSAGQQCQPEDDHTADPGHICFVTGNGQIGGAAADSDVDGGRTTLLSPIFELNGATSATLSYWRWYTNSLGDNPNQDYWDVDVTADGANWVHLEHTRASASSWTERVFNLADYIPLAQTIRFRFVADDAPQNSLVEAAVDDITVSIFREADTDVAAVEGGARTGLGECRPNPSRSGAELTYRLSSASPVRVEIYDAAGRRVRTLRNGPEAAGTHTLRFATADQFGRRLASGVYFVRLETGGLVQVKQIAVLR